MGKARCCLCGKDIGLNQHYFIMRNRTLCRECGLKFKGKMSEVCNSNGDSANCVGNGNKGE